MVFCRSDTGDEPVREWLRALPHADRKAIGEDIKTVQFGWPLGMPLVRKMESDLWEVRSDLSGKRTARVLFTAAEGVTVLLHGFVKKTQKTPEADMEIAGRRAARLRGER